MSKIDVSVEGMPLPFSYLTVDPRLDLSSFDGANTLGIEITVPVLAQKCELGNVDPQHGYGITKYDNGGFLEGAPDQQDSQGRAAIEIALTFSLPISGAWTGSVLGRGAKLATIRPDLDSVGAMAVLTLRYLGAQLSEASLNRIHLVALSDKGPQGGWQPRSLPTTTNRWPIGMTTSVDANPFLAAMSAAVSDPAVLLEERVRWMMKWILEGERPSGYQQQIEAERAKLVTESVVATGANGKIAVVLSEHRGATALGYCLAPVVVCRNPAFRICVGEPHVKYTICAHGPGYADLDKACAELAVLEPGWGGGTSIKGSPQGKGSDLTLDQVIGAVGKYLITAKTIRWKRTIEDGESEILTLVKLSDQYRGRECVSGDLKGNYPWIVEVCSEEGLVFEGLYDLDGDKLDGAGWSWEAESDAPPEVLEQVESAFDTDSRI